MLVFKVKIRALLLLENLIINLNISRSLRRKIFESVFIFGVKLEKIIKFTINKSTISVHIPNSLVLRHFAIGPLLLPEKVFTWGKNHCKNNAFFVIRSESEKIHAKHKSHRFNFRDFATSLLKFTHYKYFKHYLAENFGNSV